jgi:predicted metal-dependent phosphoesterase TrpH
MVKDPGLKIDLHMHTTVSDGTDTPERILGLVREAGIGVFSVTDHDAVRAAGIIRPLLGPGDPRFIPGAEFSCRDGEGKYHILGYGFDPASAPILELVGRSHALRMRKVTARLDFLRTEFGFTFPDDEIGRLLSMDNPGKPHIGNLMVRYGYAATKEQAIKEYIDRASVREGFIRPEEAVSAIAAGGGIPVLAHPFYGSGDELILGGDMERRLKRLESFGLRGIEACYSGFTAKLRETALALARSHGLLVTAGSDYHGSNKLVRLGDTGLGDSPLPPEVTEFTDICLSRRGLTAAACRSTDPRTAD